MLIYIVTQCHETAAAPQAVRATQLSCKGKTPMDLQLLL
jgi:hypothetical protein